MKQLVVKLSKKKSFGNSLVYSYEEELERYKKKCKKPFLRTEACFSWNFDSTIKELRESYFVYPLDEDSEVLIKNNCKVLEEHEITD